MQATTEPLPIDAEHWGIPILDPAMQASRADLAPHWFAWGSKARRPGAGKGKTVHFYVSDHHFSALIRRPVGLVAFAPAVAVEPNFSTWPGMPLAEALWWTYHKRRIAQSWQDAGIPILVDLNVAVEDRYRTLNLLGVPEGWSSYATRHHRDTGLAALDEDFRVAKQHWLKGGLDRSPEFLFVVYGGGVAVRNHCDAGGWVWVPEQSDVARGRFVDGANALPCTETDGTCG
ncbi:MAG: DUF4417 domain-containing protein [Isosphaeraceae bacterium]